MIDKCKQGARDKHVWVLLCNTVCQKKYLCAKIKENAEWSFQKALSLKS